MEYILKKVKFSQSKLGKAISGKGFYIALCLSLVAVGVAGIFAYENTVKKLSDPPAVTWPQNESGVIPDEGAESAGMINETVPLENEPVAAEPMVMPLNGEIINPYSCGELVKSTTTNIWATHNGVDIACDLGAQVKAVAKGTITDVGEDPLWGNYVIIDHDNGYETKYCSLNASLPVKKGDEVSSGTIIGSVADSAQIEIADQTHLHFEMKQNGKYVDPIQTISPSSK